MTNNSIDYSPLTCNLISLTDGAAELLDRIFPSLRSYLEQEHIGTKFGATQPKICDMALTNDTDADYLIAVGDGTPESLAALNEVFDDKPRQTLLLAVLVGEADACPPCATFITEEGRLEELLYDISALIAVRRYCNTSFENVFDFFRRLGVVRCYNYSKRLSPLDFEEVKQCWITIARPEENLTADTTLLEDVLLLLPDDCKVMWNMRACRAGERGVSVRLYS